MKTIDIIMFGGLKSFFPSTLTVNVKSDFTGESLINHLKELQPDAANLLNICQLAVEETIVDKSLLLPPDCSLVLLPPFSGG